MLELINRINGYIRHSSRFVQLNRVCALLGVKLLTPDNLHNKHGWFAGFFFIFFSFVIVFRLDLNKRKKKISGRYYRLLF